jgi:tetratricopeptide (TPR) repeat protein
MAMRSLTWGYLRIGRKAEAVALCELLRDLSVKKLGADHPLTLMAMKSLPRIYLYSGKTAEAVALYEQVRDMCVKRLGADHPQTLDTLYGLAEAYQAVGNLEQALPLLLQAAVGCEKRHFVDSSAGPIVAALIVDYFERLKQYDQAEVWQRKWLAVVKERSGADSLPFATELALLGLNLLKQKRWTDAEAMLRDCLAIREKKQPDDWTTFIARSMLGEALNGQQKRADAEQLLLQGYEGMKQRVARIPIEGKPRVAEALERLVQLYDAWSKPDQATRWRRELESEKADAKPPDQ